MTTLLTAVPLIPDGDEARGWAEDELSRSAYEIARPTAFDRAVSGFVDFVERILNTEVSGGWGRSLAIIAVLVVIALIIVGFLIWGRPRARVRVHPHTAELFGVRETRSAAELRNAAQDLASEKKWSEAIVVRFRALALSLTERGLIETPPGTTAQGFARRAARIVPSHGKALVHAATLFDDIRYLRRNGEERHYAQLAEIDEALAAEARVTR
ncbi:hypothetical protein FHX49_001886 [Microbacterium endophyticum]|uniref:Protein-glutamine gamma-glutamyltransferase-like C-terminal domain-containing protein n=1 Tax=Microbacterium endophyticum TaxID=1526412 RepID=A0A7W4YNM0_9MICO|nr:DUF4129 domain-containing protein [Microbacterium endophyticum]MBB2976312.1 hypothetical protein [Microbacterium endophyticum]NIK35192.1 hypothetical protein [Microbacterium endophyticum]